MKTPTAANTNITAAHRANRTDGDASGATGDAFRVSSTMRSSVLTIGPSEESSQRTIAAVRGHLDGRLRHIQAARYLPHRSILELQALDDLLLACRQRGHRGMNRFHIDVFAVCLHRRARKIDFRSLPISRDATRRSRRNTSIIRFDAMA